MRESISVSISIFPVMRKDIPMLMAAMAIASRIAPMVYFLFVLENISEYDFAEFISRVCSDVSLCSGSFFFSLMNLRLNLIPKLIRTMR